MKKNSTYIDANKLETILVEMKENYPQLEIKVQASFVKVSGAKGRNMYIPIQKSVNRVDLSGFTHEKGVDLGERSFGNVKQQMNFDKLEGEILGDFREILEHMLNLGAREQTRKGNPKNDSSVGWSFASKDASSNA